MHFILLSFFMFFVRSCSASNCSCEKIQSLETKVTELTEGMAKLAKSLAELSGGRVPGSKCPNNWKTYRNSCYLFASNNLRFVEAEEFCEEHGGHLVHVDDYFENRFIKGQLEELKAGDYIWMGLTDIVSEKVWVWYGTKNEAVFTDWSPREPNNMGGEDCVVFMASRSFTWNDVACWETASFVCEM